MTQHHVTVRGNPHWCDWRMQVTRPIVSWWSRCPRKEYGDIVVPAEVGEVLFVTGAAIPFIITDKRNTDYLDLPWVTSNE